MKKLLTLIIFAGLFTNVKSQRVYLQGGVNFANITTSNSGATQNSNMLTTFNAGVMARSNTTEPIALEAGLLVKGKGAQSNIYLTTSSDDNYIKTTFNPLYLELPVNFVLRLPLENKNNIFVNVGPYAAMGFTGKAKTEIRILGVSTLTSADIQFNNDDPSTSQQEDASYNKLKKFDYGINAGAGFDLGKILIKANYGLGMAKINSTETNNSSNNKNKYRTISVSLGIPLGR